jgi:hypothetical protein
VKTACFRRVGCPGFSYAPVGMHFISARLSRRQGASAATFSTTASTRPWDTPVFVDPLCGADPRLQAGAFRFAGRIAQHAQAIGTYSHFHLRGAQRVPVIHAIR